MNTFQITQITPEQFEKRIAQIVKDQFDAFKAELSPENEKEEYLTRREVADLLKIELSTLHNWSKKGRLQPYGIGNRVYFLRSDIEKALKPLKQ